MKKELELFLCNKNIINQTLCLVEKNPYQFMRNGVWVTMYTLHIGTTIAGLNLRGLISNYADGVVETNLVYSRYGDCNIHLDEYTRREKVIAHIQKYGATYQNEQQINWFN